ncbi:MAG: hypothetical protein JRJ85_28390, partial [Deltaproteobacteria bacterium]|nr:hypothetical protein [Deltaproteobacteria bacterium]
MLQEDVRDKLRLDHEDVLRLNFIRNPGVFLYRRHHRAGLRSHIMQVLNPEDVKREKEGVIIDGLRHFPKAGPLKMLRVFRKRFNSMKDAEEELMRVKMVEKFLGPDCIARSDEFWSHLDEDRLVSFLYRMGFRRQKDSESTGERWIGRVRENADRLIEKIKQMILQAGHVPDLAGMGNLILTRSGNIKLV